jgi:N-acetylglucosamine-6-phosphate deacetylase
MTLNQGVENMIRYTGCSVAEAIRMAAGNPAVIYGLNDRGRIEEGKRADLITFGFSDGKITINQTLVDGIVVFDAVDGTG